MLCLTRRPGEDIIIGNNIRLTVIEIRGGAVRLGIVAPRDIPVMRSEVSDNRTRETIIEKQKQNLTPGTTDGTA